MSLPLSVLSQSGPPKSVGGVGGRGGRVGVGSCWTKNRLRMVSKVRNVRLGVFSGGGCHHPKAEWKFIQVLRRSMSNEIVG